MFSGEDFAARVTLNGTCDLQLKLHSKKEIKMDIKTQKSKIRIQNSKFQNPVGGLKKYMELLLKQNFKTLQTSKKNAKTCKKNHNFGANKLKKCRNLDFAKTLMATPTIFFSFFLCFIIFYLYIYIYIFP